MNLLVDLLFLLAGSLLLFAVAHLTSKRKARLRASHARARLVGDVPPRAK